MLSQGSGLFLLLQVGHFLLRFEENKWSVGAENVIGVCVCVCVCVCVVCIHVCMHMYLRVCIRVCA